MSNAGSRWRGAVEESYGGLPFAVWYHGYIERFVATREEGERMIARVKRRTGT